jgi:hypothetical protein
LSHPKLGANFGVLDEEDPIGSINH